MPTTVSTAPHAERTRDRVALGQSPRGGVGGVEEQRVAGVVALPQPRHHPLAPRVVLAPVPPLDQLQLVRRLGAASSAKISCGPVEQRRERRRAAVDPAVGEGDDVLERQRLVGAAAPWCSTAACAARRRVVPGGAGHRVEDHRGGSPRRRRGPDGSPSSCSIRARIHHSSLRSADRRHHRVAVLGGGHDGHAAAAVVGPLQPVAHRAARSRTARRWRCGRGPW